MNARECGFLLLTSHLGDPDRKPLTMAQFREMAYYAWKLRGMDMTAQLTGEDLQYIGYKPQVAEHVIKLLSQQDQLEWYVQEGKKKGCVPITRVSDAYPVKIRQCLDFESPGSLWAKGDISLLKMPAAALVGNRNLNIFNEAFACEVGYQAAQQGYVLVSGNARGADRVAQDSCLAAGGKVISVVADALENCPDDPNVLYLSEEGYDLGFSAARALSRNRVIHCLAQLTFVAQCTHRKGGTWNGVVKNLKYQWSLVFCPEDGSEVMGELFDRGAKPVRGIHLEDFARLLDSCKGFLDD